MSDLENFRVEVKDWLDKNCPSTMRAGAPADTHLLMKCGVVEKQFIRILIQNYGSIEWEKKDGLCPRCQKNMVVVA